MLDIISAIQSEAAPCGAASPFCGALLSHVGVALLVGAGLFCFALAARVADSMGAPEPRLPQDPRLPG
jgi:hypothetical protein